MCTVNIFVTNLGKYNEGELVGKWLSLPFTDD
ncbi:antirestriction protein ArdA [Clostridium botulinum]|nr:antirestriction protein ArdA [Clostridium botulinum]NFP28409.1 antirestriction protein ArdA [Clostridium botulinum]